MAVSRGIPCLAGLLVLAIPVDFARAQRTLSGECARADVKAGAWVDEQARQRTIPPPLLAEAALRVLQARNACLHGRVAAALEAYEQALRLADPSGTPERQAEAGK
jgi:hypothetical protein